MGDGAPLTGRHPVHLAELPGEVGGVDEPATAGDRRDRVRSRIGTGEVATSGLEPLADDPLPQRFRAALGPHVVKLPKGDVVVAGDPGRRQVRVVKVVVEVQRDTQRQAVGHDRVLSVRIFGGTDDQRTDQLGRGVADDPQCGTHRDGVEVGAELEDVIADERIDRAGFDPLRCGPHLVDRQAERCMFDPQGVGLTTADTVELIGSRLIGQQDLRQP